MSAPTCPRCDSPTQWDYACHTWSQSRSDGTDVWVACMGCDSAVLFSCTVYECGWSYKWGMNPRNPGSAANEKDRPGWLPDPIDWGQHGFVSNLPVGIRHWSDDDDDMAARP